MLNALETTVIELGKTDLAWSSKGVSGQRSPAERSSRVESPVNVTLVSVFLLRVAAAPNEINEDRLCYDISLQRDDWPWIGG